VSDELDPLSLAHKTLWDLVATSAPLAKLVRLGNQIRFDKRAFISPAKAEVASADLPELALVVTQLSGKVRNTSSSSMLTLTMDWWLSTGDMNVQRGVLPVAFAVYAACVKWPDLAKLVQWRGTTPIKRVDLTTATLGITDSGKNRGVVGWSAVWSCEIEMHVPTALVLAYNDGQ